jgi:uncharacterized membrane protein YgcG
MIVIETPPHAVAGIPAEARRGSLRWRFACLLAISCGALAQVVHADERILDFHSDITIAPDAGMDVVETIRVRAEGSQIRHGIYRDFPTEYRDRWGHRVHVDFEPESVTRDGVSEPFHTSGQVNGVRVYFGSEDTTLEPGEYTYVLRYRTSRQLGFFDDHDELYWNVTGNGWDFLIDAASATVALPGSIAPSALKVEAYTGEQGARGSDYTASADAASHAVFRTTRTLGPGEGLTIVVAFPKGVVAEPTNAERARWFLRDNGAVVVGGAGLLLLWAYYLWQWMRVGRDPKPGVIIPQYEAPEGCSPGMLRHVERMKYDNRCFAADVVDLAVRGEIEIHEKDGVYTLERTNRVRDRLPAPESALLDAALGGRSKLELKRAEHLAVASALKRHRESIEKIDVGRYFHTNSKLVIPGVIIGVAALLLGLFARGATPALAGAGFMLFWLAGWTAGVAALVASAIRAWREPPGIGTYAGALFLTLFSLPFLAGELFGIGMFATLAGVGFTVVVAALVGTQFTFLHLLKAPTKEGRKLLDHIAGLKLYLGVAERDTLARLQAPPMTVDEFQRFLPYALALGVEKTWADRFSAAVGPAAAAAAATAMGWYHSSSGVSSLSNLTSGIGSSLSGAISSSSTAPGSSSGSGGGGSSGGGGGGGGGGGW